MFGQRLKYASAKGSDYLSFCLRSLNLIFKELTEWIAEARAFQVLKIKSYTDILLFMLECATRE